jgi:type VI secretion system protein
MAGAETSRTLDHGGIAIGRGASNDWALPDPEKLLSKTHCRIDFVGNHYAITDTSTNGVFINAAAAPLGRGNSAVLSDGDRLKLGHHEINVQLTASPAPSRALGDPEARLGDLDPFGVRTGVGTDSPFDQPSAPRASGHLPSDLPTDAGRGDDDPLADLGSEPGVEAGGWSGSFGEEAAGGPGRGRRAREIIPEHTDIFSDLGVGMESEAAPPENQVGSEPDHVASEHEYFQPPNLVQEKIPANWDTAEGEEPKEAAEEVVAPPFPPQGDKPASGAGPARAAGEAPPNGQGYAAAPAPVRPEVVPAPADAALVAAFLTGAGLGALDMGKQNPAELMHSLGGVLRAMVEGLRENLMARSTIKSELRLERTVIQAAANNPLKFSASLEEALAAMVQPELAGYLPPAAAVKEGFNDLKTHQIATMTGMQFALSALLGEFDPGTLKERLERHSMLQSLMPAARKAKYWEMYEALYKEIAKDAENSFNGRYAREFARAYDEQVRKL